MRLDKYLKVSRLVKRRTLAKEVCDAGRIELNGRVAKAGAEVKVGDLLALNFGPRRLKVRIEELRESVRAAEAASLYTILEERLLKNAAPLEGEDDENEDDED
jgi:ribosomal 50S subunit-recycling heat shock protein